MGSKKQEVGEVRTLLVERGHERFRVTIPAEWKVTFGRLYGASGPRDYDSPGMGLRIYETETKQRACFTGVTGFRDLSIPVERLVVSESGEESWSADENGHERKTKVKRERSWVGDD